MPGPGPQGVRACCSRSHSGVAEAGGGDLTFGEKPIAARRSAPARRCRRLQNTCESQDAVGMDEKVVALGESSLSGFVPRVSYHGRGSRTKRHLLPPSVITGRCMNSTTHRLRQSPNTRGYCIDNTPLELRHGTCSPIVREQLIVARASVQLSAGSRITSHLSHPWVSTQSSIHIIQSSG